MLPPGHIAAGYLVSEALLKVVPYQFTQIQREWLVIWGMFFSFAPDLDAFYSFAIARSMKHLNVSHRKYISHRPVLWLIAGLVIFLAAGSPFYKTLGLLVWLGSWTHFFFDSFFHAGVMWLWPFSSRIFNIMRPAGFQNFENHIAFEEKKESFVGYWNDFILNYIKVYAVSFSTEIILLIIAILYQSKII